MKAIHTLKNNLQSIKASPEKISKGYALGIFLGTTPFIGTKVFIALGLTYFLKWSKIASVIGVYHINLFTAPFFYTLSFFIGKSVTRTQLEFSFPDKMTLSAVFNLFVGNWEILKALLVGGLILGIPMAIMAYLFSSSILKIQNSN